MIENSKQKSNVISATQTKISATQIKEKVNVGAMSRHISSFFECAVKFWSNVFEYSIKIFSNFVECAIQLLFMLFECAVWFLVDISECADQFSPKKMMCGDNSFQKN